VKGKSCGPVCKTEHIAAKQSLEICRPRFAKAAID
jgi:hypothetical protein